jgi:hypothetical protein
VPYRAIWTGALGKAQEGFAMKSIFDSSFEYTPSFDTDVRKTFDRVRREQGQVRGRLPLVKSQPETQVEVLKLEQFKRASHT